MSEEGCYDLEKLKVVVRQDCGSAESFTGSRSPPSAAAMMISRYQHSLSISSWLPPKPTDEEELPNEPLAAEENDDDWEGMTELQGVGSKRKAEDEGVLDGLKRKKLSSDNKLLELLLGKKAAQARKKTLETSRYRGRAAALKPLEKRGIVPQQRDVSEDEEEGRAASFKSRKSKAMPVLVAPEPELDGQDESIDAEEGMDAEPRAQPQLAEEESPPPAKKRKAGSYLDEILNQKAAKQGKKKKKKQQQQHKPDSVEA
ncbi:hypothetical protein LTR29_016302 [Friedmanniomyces endolithicus]|nr:hypothetical protein LTR29_016302 [Friedmanniomyces endolithicus]